MADIRNLTPEDLERENQLIRERDEILQRLEERNKRLAVAGGEEVKRLKRRNEADREHLQTLSRKLSEIQEIREEADEYTNSIKDALEKQDEYNQLQEDFGTSFAKLSDRVKGLLISQEKGGGAFAAITARILEIKKQEINASGDELTSLQTRRAELEKIRQTQIDSAESLAMEKENFLGITDAARRRQEFQSSIVGLNEQDKELAEQAFERNEALIAQQERLNELNSQLSGLYSALPQGLQKMIGGISSLIKGTMKGLGPIVIVMGLLALAIKEFTDLSAAQKKFRQETGLTASQTKEIDEQVKSIRKEFANLGVEAEDVYDTIAALKKEFGDAIPFTEGVVSSIVVMNKNLGIAQDDAAAVNMIFQNMAGLSAATAQNVSMQLADMAKISGVAPAQLFKDIAESAEESYKYFRGNVNQLAKSAIEARRLGTNIKTVLSTTEKLLDFEEGIEKELVAATFVGGQFNLSQARALAYAGRHLEAQQEILRQIQRSGDFRDKDVFTQRALADAAGMTVEQIMKQITMQERLVGLSDEQKKLVSDAMDAGLDLANLSDSQLSDKVKELETQQEIADAVTKMENAFSGIIASLSTGLVPLMEGLAPLIGVIAGGFGFILEVLNFIPGVLPAIIAGFTAMYVVSKKAAIQSMITAVANIWKAYGGIPFVGIGLAAGVLAALYSSVSKAKSVGDMAIAAPSQGGGTMVSTAEGGIFQTSRNDQVAVGPGVVDRLSQAKSLADGAMVPLAGGALAGKAIGVLVEEMKALRRDMSSGKIRASAYLDGQKVTTGLAIASEQSTRNNFSYGQRIL